MTGEDVTRKRVYEHDVEFKYPKMYLFNRMSIVLNKMMHILPKIAIISMCLGVFCVLGKEFVGVDTGWLRILFLFLFFGSFGLYWFLFFFEYIFMVLWRCPMCKGKLPFYKTVFGYIEEGESLINEEVKDICERKNRKITLLRISESKLLVPKKCPHCSEMLWEKR